MSWLSLAEVAEMTGGQLLGANADISGVSIDTRTLKAGEIFIALKGERFDGHDHVAQIEERAAGLLVSRHVESKCAQILVQDTLSALTAMARSWRERIEAPVIGLTGSNGKTTVKEMIASILGYSNSVYATRGNLNNHIGVPLSLLTVRPEHEFAVIEMGANHLHEIADLSQTVQPNVALITNAGPAHLEGFGSVEGVAKGKGEIFQGLTDEGIAIINADDDYFDFWSTLCGNHRRISFGFADTADVHGQLSNESVLHIRTEQGQLDVHLPLPGRHNAANALAAAAASLAVGVSLDDIRRGLERVDPVKGRLVVREGLRGCTIFDDSYNANPASLQAALEVLASRPGRHWLVLGDMGELGEQAAELHASAGRMACQYGLEKLLAIGRMTQHAVNAFGLGGVHFPSTESLNEYLCGQVSANVNVLVKGSRLMHLERVVEVLISGELRTGTLKEKDNAA